MREKIRTETPMILTLLLALILTACTYAQNLLVNGSFEADVLSDDTLSGFGNGPSGWVLPGGYNPPKDVQVWNPLGNGDLADEFPVFGRIPDGDNVSYHIAGQYGSTLFQVIEIPGGMQAGETYTFSGYAGYPVSDPAAGLGEEKALIRLYSIEDPADPFAEYDTILEKTTWGGDFSISAGTFTPFRFSFTVSPSSRHIGRHIYLLLAGYDGVCYDGLEMRGPDEETPLPDLSGDRKVNNIDLSIFSENWLDNNNPPNPPGGVCGDANHPYPVGDLNEDCVLDITDLLGYAAFWLESEQTGIKRVNSLKDQYFESPDHDWAKWIVVSWAPGQIAEPRWTDAERQEYLDLLDPDHLDEWGGQLYNRGDFARMRGIASNTPMENIWESEYNNISRHAAEFFTGNGLAVKENGSYCYASSTTNNLCQQGPKWHEITKQSSGRMAIYGDSIFQDRFCGGVSDWPQYGWCDWCNKNFIDYMITHFTAGELVDMGFDPSSFHIRDYMAVQRGSLTDQQLLEDPIIHEYIRFKYTSEMYLAVDAVNHYHHAAAKAGAAIPAFYGNQGMISGERTFAAIMSPHVDIVWCEQSAVMQPCFEPSPRYPSGVYAFSTLLWKNGRAGCHYEKAVIALQYPDVSSYGGVGPDKRYPMAVVNAEATANGGVSCQTWKSSNHRKTPADDILINSQIHHAQFVSKNRGLFMDRTSVVDHALVYSVPSLFWSYFSSLTLPVEDRHHLIHFGAAGRLLEGRHIPYNTLFFGHPDVYDDTYDLTSLDQYKTLILAYADCIADYQANAVKKWTRAGGKLVLWAQENVGTRDEELAARTMPAFDDLIANPGAGTVEIITTSQADAYIAGGSDSAIAPKIADSLAPVIETTAPSTVWLNVWRHGAGPMTSVQMVNYDIDPDADTLTSTGSFTVSLREPTGVTFTQAHYINTDYIGTNPPTTFTPLAISRSNGYVEVTVPSLDLFGIVIFSVENELDARLAAGHTRKWYERLKIALRCQGQNEEDHAVLLSDCKNLLDSIQGDVVVTDFASLTPQLTAKAAELQNDLNGVTAAVTAFQDTLESEALNITADYKFDFGPIDSTAPGWTEVTTNTTYSAQQGYGWTSYHELGAYDSAGSTIAYWQFDEDGIAPQDALGYYHLRLSPDLPTAGSRTTDVAVANVPNPEQGSFDSDDPASNPYAVDGLRAFTEYTNQFDFNDKPLTVEGWFKHAPGSFWEHMCGTMSAAGNYLGWRLELISPGYLRINMQSPSYRQSTLATAEGTSYADNQWHHFAIVWEPEVDDPSTPNYIDGRVRIYVDGGLKKAGYGAGKLGTAFHRSFCIGVRPNSSGQFVDAAWTGKFDEFRVTRAALLPWYFLNRTSMPQSLWADECTNRMDAMNRDYIRSKDPAGKPVYGGQYPPNGNGLFPEHYPTANPATFRVDLPNGDYNVTVVTGNYNEFPLPLWGGPGNGNGRTAMTYVAASGMPMLYGDRIINGYQQNRTFQTTVTQGFLELDFSGRNAGPLYDNTIEWMVNGLIVQNLAQPLTAEAEDYLNMAQLRSDSAIRDWYIIGPFDDDDCRGLEIVYGPEWSNDIDKTYPGKNGPVSWQPIPELTGDAPYISFSDSFADIDEVAGFALTHVYCPSAMEAILVSSISQAGDIYVNGERVYRDELAAGLLPEEQKVNISLTAGWNSIMIKSLNHWGDTWSTWAALMTASKEPLIDQPGIIIFAQGDQ